MSQTANQYPGVTVGVVPPEETRDLKAVVLGHELTALADDQSEWSQSTFGTDAARGPLGPIRHLRKETVEAEEAWEAVQKAVADGDPHAAMLAEKFTEERADMLLLLLDLNRRSGGTPLSLVQAAQAKMRINRTRVYPRTPDGVPSEHVRERPGLSLAATLAVVGRRAGGVWKWLSANSWVPWLVSSVLYLTGSFLLLIKR